MQEVKFIAKDRIPPLTSKHPLDLSRDIQKSRNRTKNHSVMGMSMDERMLMNSSFQLPDLAVSKSH
jgi:cytochrome c553